jgi:hypothetical protein
MLGRVTGVLAVCLAVLLGCAEVASAKWSGSLTRASNDPASGVLRLMVTADSPSQELFLGLNQAGYPISDITSSVAGAGGFPACVAEAHQDLTTNNSGFDCSFASAVTQVTITFTTSPRYPDGGGAVANDDSLTTMNAIPGPCGALTVSAGADQTIHLGDDLTLTGTVTGGCPDPGKSVTSSWSKVSGPGNVSFGSPGSPQTTVTFGAAGTYVLQLQASDGHTSASKTVTVIVEPACEAIHSPEDICGQCPVITVVPSTLKAAVQGLPYAVKLDGNGGQAPYSFSAGATLPAGLHIDANGLLHGTVTAPPGRYSVNLSMVDARACSASNQAIGIAPTGGLVLSLVVAPPFTTRVNVHGGTVTLHLTAPAAGRFTARATTQSVATAAKHRTRVTVYAIGRVNASKAGRVQLTLTPSPAGLKLLKHDHRLRLSLAVTFKPRKGTATTTTRHLTVKAPR